MIRPFIGSSPSQVFRDRTAERGETVVAVPAVTAKGRAPRGFVRAAAVHLNAHPERAGLPEHDAVALDHARGRDRGRAEGEAGARSGQRSTAASGELLGDLVRS